MRPQAGAAGPLLVIIVAVLLAAAYSAYAADGVAQRLDAGRGELTAAMSEIDATGTPNFAEAQFRLRQAEQDFREARQRTSADPALHVLGALPISGTQLDAAATLGSIGVDLSRAGDQAAGIGVQLATFKQRVTSGPIAPDQLPALLQQAEAMATGYQGSIDALGSDLKAAHSERAKVNTSDLLPPLQHAYDDVDRALDEADTAFIRYRDVRRLLSDWLGVALPG